MLNGKVEVQNVRMNKMKEIKRRFIIQNKYKNYKMMTNRNSFQNIVNLLFYEKRTNSSISIRIVSKVQDS